MRVVVSVSGGKDSTYLAAYAIYKYGRENCIFVSADTGCEFPETHEYLNYLELKLDIKIHRVKSDRWDFFSYCRHRKKFPDARNRFCTSDLKQAPLAKWITSAGIDRYDDIMLTGERRDESTKRSHYREHYYNQKLRIAGFRPLLSLTTKDIFAGIRQAGLVPNPIYEHFTRLGCYGCVFNTIDEWVQLSKFYPDLFSKISDLENEIGYTVRQGETLRQLISRKESNLNNGAQSRQTKAGPADTLRVV